MKTTLTVQGGLVKVAVGVVPERPEELPPRGKVAGMSKKSRKRLLELFARMKPQKRTVFITLTYPSEFPDGKTAKNHLRAFLERVRRFAPKAAGVWRLEFQKRGAPHFHLIFYNLPYIDKKTVQKWWGDIIAYDRPFTRIEKIQSQKKVINYAAKYVAKLGDADASAVGFNNTPYLHAGRIWGVFNSEFLPFDEEIKIEVELSKRQFLALKVVGQLYWQHLDTVEIAGFTLFVSDAYCWIDKLMEIQAMDWRY